jgi:multiple sugar transport system permease protein
MPSSLAYRHPHHRRIRASRVISYIVLTLLAITFIFPYLWLLSSSFREPSAIYSTFSLLPLNSQGHFELVIANYANAIDYLHLGKVFLNTLIVCTVNTVVNLFLNALAGYAFARLQFKGKRVIFFLITLSIMVPGTVMTIPNLLICRFLGIDDSLWVLILPFIMSVYNVFLMRQQFYGLPKEIEEAAVVDGASPLRIFFSICLPLVAPMMVVLGITTFMWNYNNFLWSLVAIQSEEYFTLARSLGDLVSSGTGTASMYPVMLAGSVIVSAPLIVIFFAAQKYIIGGIAEGGVKE